MVGRWCLRAWIENCLHGTSSSATMSVPPQALRLPSIHLDYTHTRMHETCIHIGLKSCEIGLSSGCRGVAVGGASELVRHNTTPTGLCVRLWEVFLWHTHTQNILYVTKHTHTWTLNIQITLPPPHTHTHTHTHTQTLTFANVLYLLANRIRFLWD